MDRGNGKGAVDPGCQAALTIVSPIPVAWTLPGPVRMTTPGSPDVQVANAVTSFVAPGAGFGNPGHGYKAHDVCAVQSSGSAPDGTQLIVRLTPPVRPSGVTGLLQATQADRSATTYVRDMSVKPFDNEKTLRIRISHRWQCMNNGHKPAVVGVIAYGRTSVSSHC